jgi:hypothetical protein
MTQKTAVIHEYPDNPNVEPMRVFHVRMSKYRSTWSWFTTNPQGGGFGSNHCGTKRDALARALRSLRAGDKYSLTVNEQDCGIYTVGGAL